MARATTSGKHPPPTTGGHGQPVQSSASAATLDRLIHERMRLGIVTALAANASLSFTELKRLLRTTDGNLSVHAGRLEAGGYISTTKSFDRRTPRTDYRLTAAGRAALTRYLEHMEALIKTTRSAIGG